MTTFAHEPMNFKTMPPAIKGLIIANIAVFLLTNIVGDPFYQLFGLVPRRVLSDRYVWQVVSYLFVHGGFMHLLFNLFSLWMFGMPVESQWGAAEFLKYYFLCGLGAAAANLLLTPHSMVPIIGASGSIFGILVAFAMLYPDSVVYMYWLIPVRAAHMAIIWGLMELYAGTSGATPGIARFAHLGGMVTGYLYIRWWWVLKVKLKGVYRDYGSEGVKKVGIMRRVELSRPHLAPEREKTMEEVDRILDKILATGMDSLTDEEREVMRRYSERMKH